MMVFDPASVTIPQGGELLYLLETTSTMDVAYQALHQDPTPFTTIVAERQLQGRGRRGRSWRHMPGANLAFTTILPAPIPNLPLLVAVALHRALTPMLATTPQIKWPNDILLEMVKCGGILVERASVAGADYLLVGVGLNVKRPPAEFTASVTDRAITNLETHGCKRTREGILSAILWELAQVIQLGWPQVYQEYVDHCVTIGHTVTWRENDSPLGDKIVGRAVRLSEDGALELIALDGTLHTIHAGEVLLHRDDAPAQGSGS